MVCEITFLLAWLSRNWATRKSPSWNRDSSICNDLVQLVNGSGELFLAKRQG